MTGTSHRRHDPERRHDHGRHQARPHGPEGAKAHANPTTGKERESMTTLPVDHLVFLVPHIDDYVDEFARVTGVTPVFGGVHAGKGTKNYLVRLDAGDGNPAYLELLGLDDAQTDVPADATMFRVGRYGPDPRPHLTTWAIHPGNLTSLTATATARGIRVGAVEEWSRNAPDGSVLEWSVAIHPDLPLGGLQPFLIDWGTTPHPSTNPHLGTISLVGLRFEHPRPETLTRSLAGLGLSDIPPIGLGLVPTIIATIDTPHGRLELR